MEKINNYYESLFIVDVANGEEATKASVEKFVGIINANAETVVEVAEWGKRRLAYPINDRPEGYYVVVTFQAAPEFPAELERLFNIDEAILRSVLIRLDFVPTAKATVVEEAPVAEVAVEAAVEAEVEAPADAE
ncbi:MAG: 30S ribosomal protein S6 [Ruminococcaceae bacterium]|nr:30S ribosomal protein S6 [Oscillospiraceae bacterium]